MKRGPRGVLHGSDGALMLLELVDNCLRWGGILWRRGGRADVRRVTKAPKDFGFKDSFVRMLGSPHHILQAPNKELPAIAPRRHILVAQGN